MKKKKQRKVQTVALKDLEARAAETECIGGEALKELAEELSRSDPRTST